MLKNIFTGFKYLNILGDILLEKIIEMKMLSLIGLFSFRYNRNEAIKYDLFLGDYNMVYVMDVDLLLLRLQHKMELGRVGCCCVWQTCRSRASPSKKSRGW